MTIPVRPLQVLIGVSLVAAAVTGRTALLVRPWFVPLVVATGVLLLVGAARSRASTTPRVTPAAALLLVLPVVAGVALTPELVGRVPPEPTGTATVIGARIGDAENPLLAGGDGEVTILDVVLAEQQVGAAALDGRRVTVEGVATADGTVARQVMVCCAADARPVTLPLRGALPAPGTWVRAEGRLAADGPDLVLRVATVTPIPTPEDPLL